MPHHVDDDARASDWSAFLHEIEELLATGRYTWAEGTLRGIHETVERTGMVSPNQRRAVRNIEAAGLRPRWGRR